jgi:2-polyprenyl-3-methyl-5-hydroxy-6-metoxy-1,4-benzoquinol methylase
MPTDYEKVYQQQRDALGKPTKEFVVFFDKYEKEEAHVLDIGCGQGRDALFIARRGHHVTGIDISETGIAQMQEDARREGLKVDGHVIDLCDYNPDREYDVVVIDRTLHMLAEDTRLELMKRLSRATRVGGYLLIADQKSNLPAMKALLENDGNPWTIVKHTRGFLFVRKDT